MWLAVTGATGAGGEQQSCRKAEGVAAYGDDDGVRELLLSRILALEQSLGQTQTQGTGKGASDPQGEHASTAVCVVSALFKCGLRLVLAVLVPVALVAVCAVSARMASSRHYVVHIT